MKTLFQIILVALVMGGVSGGASYYHHQQLAKIAAAAMAAALEKISTDEKSASEKAKNNEIDLDSDEETSTDSLIVDDAEPETEASQSMNSGVLSGPPAGIRPPWDPNGDEAGNLINIARKNAATLVHQERWVAEREQAMNLIVNDMRSEQVNVAKLRKRIVNETKFARKAIVDLRTKTAAEREAQQTESEAERTRLLAEKDEERRITEEKIDSLRREKDEAQKVADAALKSIRADLDEFRRQWEASRKQSEPVDESGSPDQTAGLKKLKESLNSIPPEEIAKIVNELVEEGRTAGAVAILNAMDAKKKGKVIASISAKDSKRAAVVLEQLKQFKGN